MPPSARKKAAKKAPTSARKQAPTRPAKKPASSGATFEDVFADVGRVVKKVFPKAKPVESFGMKGWKVPRPASAPRPPKEGTMPSDSVMVLLADRAAGPTLHLWYPGDYSLLDGHAPMLKEAGFKVMRGCLPFTRKQAYPIDAVEAILRDIRARDGA